VGLGTGVIAYVFGFPTSARARQGGPDELRYVPANAALVAFADVHQIMTSDTRQRLRSALPDIPNGQQEFQTQTGINIETDIDRVVAFIAPHAVDGKACRAQAWSSRVDDSIRSASSRSCDIPAAPWRITKAR